MKYKNDPNTRPQTAGFEDTNKAPNAITSKKDNYLSVEFEISVSFEYFRVDRIYCLTSLDIDFIIMQWVFNVL